MAVILFIELLEGAYSRGFTLKNLSYVKQLGLTFYELQCFFFYPLKIIKSKPRDL